MTEQELSFEDAYAELERVVEALEGGASTLEETLSLYERGITLAAYCESLLEKAELRVKELQRDEDGNLEVTDLKL